ncbi:hypothetical protein ABK669_00005, partial [Enterobacter hormaechei]|uniref:hypothetical protein n=1 Tax=Enterobacter hormaechei TaxID=158836 RepID=UPI0037506BCA
KTWYGGHIDGSFLSIIYPLLDCSGIPILTTLAEVWNVRSWHKTAYQHYKNIQIYIIPLNIHN